MRLEDFHDRENREAEHEIQQQMFERFGEHELETDEEYAEIQCETDSRPDFSFQEPGIERILAERDLSGAGWADNRLLVTAPTGAGKGTIIAKLAEMELDRGGRPIVYTNRKVIRQQISDRLDTQGITHGIRAAGFQPDLHNEAQVSSVQTERHRGLKPEHPWELHDCTLAMVDEAHSQRGTTATKLINHHAKNGAFVVGFTATPCVPGLGELWKKLLILAKNSDLLKAGVLVPVDTFSPSEIDMEGVDLRPDGEFVTVQMQGRFERVKHTVVGDVLKWYDILNPTRKPSILFPPGVAESRWFTDVFNRRGIACAHIDADTPDHIRQQAFRDHKQGKLKMISSYGVLAEGWDAPWAQHAILCRPVAAVHTYIQLVGRIMRAAPGKSRAILQDHVGAWHRPGLGSPDRDRDWTLDLTSRQLSKEEKKLFADIDEKEHEEPVRCPKCSSILPFKPSPGYICPHCQHEFKLSIRMVFQQTGELIPVRGRVVKHEKKTVKDDTYYFRTALFMCSWKNWSVKQAWAIATRMKQEQEGEDAYLSTTKIAIACPPHGSPEWSYSVNRVFPWCNRRKGRRR